MLFSLSHGQHIVRDVAPAPGSPSIAAASETAAHVVPLSAVIAASPAPAPSGMVVAAAASDGTFNYYFPAAAGLPTQPNMPDLLDALADSMVDPPGDGHASDSRIPPIFTYFGQFIDHDITANTDRDSGLSTITGAITPLSRAHVAANLGNLRDGTLALDSLYGDTVGQGPFAAKLAGLMRHPTLTAKMRLGVPDMQAGPRVPLPALPDNATDLLRLGFLMDKGKITQAELEALTPAALKGTFLRADGTPILARAIIGDGRNDENLIVAQLHVLLLRLHNKFVDATGNFDDARRLTRWHYQWLVINAYLTTICDVATLQDVIAGQAPLYAQFLAANPANGPKMPMPLEFSVAAFRFGHSMVRAAYDHNRVFGKPVPGTPNFIDPAAPFSLLFGFTGNGNMLGNLGAKQLPANWVIEWDRWVKIDTANPIRAARKIDTDLAPPLSDMVNESDDPTSIFRHLARRNLRRGYRLNLPTAQDAIAAIAGVGGAPIPPLTPAQLAKGSAARAAAIAAGGFDVATPLWFYILREAEALSCGERLGPLGSRLIAETLVGLVVNDPESYWNAPGSDAAGRWRPEDFDDTNPVDSLEDMARFCGML